MYTRIYLFVKTSLILAIIASLFLIYASLFSKTYAANLTGASNTITTSRPSASSPLSADGASADTLLLIFNNGSFFLASDSAKIINGTTGGLVDLATIVSSQSAALTTVFFGETIGSDSFEGVNVLMVPITAMHSIVFTIPQEIPNTGDIIITFPSLGTDDANNEASPSATTFQFNNMDTLDTSLIKLLVDDTDRTGDMTFEATNPTGAGDGGDIKITVSTGFIAAGTEVEIFIGCTTVAAGDCTVQTPTLINPTKTATAGTADVWKINVQTRDGSAVNLDNATIAVGTIDSVTVRATVDPTLSFTITGLDNGDPVNDVNTDGCAQSEATNAGIDASATEVNLGLLAETPPVDGKVGNIAAQRINITTNGVGGYVLTATASGQLINPSTGVYLESSTTPASFPSNGSDWFGIHPCGLDVSAATWIESGSGTACESEPATSTNNECFYGWPTQTTSITLATDSSGPIGNSVELGNGIISVAYAAGTDALIPPGEYRTIITYVATPTF